MWEYKHYYDKEINWFDDLIMGVRDLQVMGMIEKFISCKSVIEVGPGRGTFGRLCRARNIKYTAVEASSIGVERLKKEGLVVHKALFPDYEVTEEFDLFMARSVLEHTTGTVQANEFIKTAIKCVKPNGILFIEVPDIRFYKWDYYSDYGHNYVCSLDRLEQLMQEYDLDVLKSGTKSQFICSPFDKIPYFLSYLPLSMKLKTSFYPNAYVIAGKGG